MDTMVKDLVEEIVKIKRQMDELGVSDLVKRFEGLKKQLVQFANEFDEDGPARLEGAEGHAVTFSKAPKEKKVTDLPLVKKALGDQVFFQIAKITVADLKQWVPEGELMNYCEESYGSRRLTKVEY